MFGVVGRQAPLTQGDVFEECPLVQFDIASPRVDPNDPLPKFWRGPVIVLTQACDLVQGKSNLVLVAQVRDAQHLVDLGVLKATTIRDQIRRHQVLGWYFLRAVTAPVELPESIVDLRDIHSVPRVVLEELIARGKRVATLLSPYREHLAQHFAVTYMRVALPEPYPTTP
jgi:hypothetical protein